MKKALLAILMIFFIFSGCSIPDTPDTIIPTVVILYPMDGQSVNGTVEINIAAGDDDDIKRLDLYIDGSVVYSWDKQKNSYLYSWNTSSLEENSEHILSAIVHDDSDNMGFSGNINVTVSSAEITDVTAPVINILAPVAGNALATNTNIVVDVIDDSDIEKVEFYIDGELLSTYIDAPYEYLLDISSYSSGSQHSLYVKAYDVNGNVGTALQIFTIQ